MCDASGKKACATEKWLLYIIASVDKSRFITQFFFFFSLLHCCCCVLFFCICSYSVLRASEQMREDCSLWRMHDLCGAAAYNEYCMGACC